MFVVLTFYFILILFYFYVILFYFIASPLQSLCPTRPLLSCVTSCQELCSVWEGCGSLMRQNILSTYKCKVAWLLKNAKLSWPPVTSRPPSQADLGLVSVSPWSQ